jgi:hypothetical protein
VWQHATALNWRLFAGVCLDKGPKLKPILIHVSFASCLPLVAGILDPFLSISPSSGTISVDYPFVLVLIPTYPSFLLVDILPLSGSWPTQ